ncbi:MAG: response regulator [Deltaproteobacteria bacterium]|nr:response regulator [Deltaproteobacteria bacterium]
MMKSTKPDHKSKSGLKAMHLNRLSLRFSGPMTGLEKPYREHYLVQTLSQIRISFILGALMFGFFGILDALVLPQHRHITWLIRYALVCPSILTVVGATYFPRLHGYLQPMMSVAVVIGGGGIIWMTVIVPEPLNYYYYAGMILVLMFGYSFIYLRFLWASLSGWIIVILYNIASILNGTPSLELISNNFFLVSANIAGMLICYTIEFMGRRNFFLMHLLAEEQRKIEKANDQLEGRVSERTAALEEMNHQLSLEMAENERAEKERRRLEEQLKQAEKLETIGRLTAGVAHDLNNILSGLVTYPDMLLMDLPEDSSWQKPLSIIQQSGQKAAAIVQDLLSLARQGMTQKEIVNLNRIVSDYLASPEYDQLLLNHHQVRVEVDLDERALNIKGSAFHISKALMNLVHNACEANLVDGTVRITAQNRYLDKPTDAYERIEEGEYVVLSVADTGIGINREDLTKIFEPFYTKKKLGRSGTGLGMTLIWSTVKDHDGFMDIQTDEGRGTVFDLYFPISRDAAEEMENHFSLEDCRGAERILVVDDVPEQREIASLMLRKLGYTVQTVDSGEAAIKQLENDRVDILILDMIMDPGIDGCETYRRIVAAHPGQKAIIASGFTESGRVKEAQRLGAGTYIKKPYSLEVIARAIRCELDR